MYRLVCGLNSLSTSEPKSAVD